MKRILTHFLVLLVGTVVISSAQENTDSNDELSALRIMERSQEAFYYQADAMKAMISMELIDKDGRKRSRRMSMLRRDASEGGEQKYFIYFHEPGDVRDMTFMVWKYPAKDDERWIYIPAVDLVRRIAADDKRSSFVGSDFTYEDISGRSPASDDHTLIGRDKLGGRECFIVESIPKEKSDHAKRMSFIDVKTYLPLKEEYYDVQNELFRVFTADSIETISSFPTVVKRTMKNVKTGHRTEVTFTSVSYNIGLKEEDFSERNLRRPPRSWIK